MNAASPGVVAHFMPNAYYETRDAYVLALGEALTGEYEAIHEAGFLLQIDCPDLAMIRHMEFAGRSLEDFRRAAEVGVEALNHATRNIPAGAMRMHICWGNYPGPHTHDVPFAAMADIVFRARPSTVLFEGANPQHGHQHEELADLPIPRRQDPRARRDRHQHQPCRAPEAGRPAPVRLRRYRRARAGPGRHRLRLLHARQPAPGLAQHRLGEAARAGGRRGARDRPAVGAEGRVARPTNAIERRQGTKGRRR